MDGDVCPAVEDGSLHLFHEDALPADPVEVLVLSAVALGVDDDALDAHLRVLCLEGAGHEVGLDEREG